MPAPTIASLCRALGTDLTPAPGFTAPRVEISAVHISELLDPTSYLSGGELLLTTGLALPRSMVGCERYVGRLKEVGLAALAFGLGPVHTEIPAALVAACRKFDVALLTVPEPTPFLRITKAYWTAVSRSTEQLLKDVLATQRALVEAAASPDPVSGLLRTLARSLDAWCATFSAAGALDHVYPPGMLDEAEQVRGELARLEGAGVHSSASFSAGGVTVIIFPMASGDRVLGYLAVGTTAPLVPDRRRTVLTASALLSLDAVRRQRAETSAETAERCVGLLVDLGHVEAARAMALEVDCHSPPSRVRVLMLRGNDSTELIATVRRWCESVLAVAADPSTAWFLVPARHPALQRLDARLASADPSVVALVSDVVHIEQVSPVRVLLESSMDALTPGSRNLTGESPYDGGLADRLGTTLGELTPPHLEGLVAYLRHRGQWESASRDLGVHRNTLRQRIERCRDQFSADIDDPDVAAQLWLLLRRRGLA